MIACCELFGYNSGMQLLCFGRRFHASMLGTLQPAAQYQVPYCSLDGAVTVILVPCVTAMDARIEVTPMIKDAIPCYMFVLHRCILWSGGYYPSYYPPPPATVVVENYSHGHYGYYGGGYHRGVDVGDVMMGAGAGFLLGAILF